MGVSYGLLRQCGGPIEMVFSELVLKKCLPILFYGLDCIKLRSWQRHKANVLFNNVIRRIYNLSVRTSVKNVLNTIKAKPVKFLPYERKCLLVVLCFSSSSQMKRRCAHLVAASDDFNRVKAVSCQNFHAL